MTREEAQSCIKTIELLRRLAYNIHGVMDVIDAKNCEKIIEALSREPSEDVRCSETPKSSERTAETTQIDHAADVSKKVERTGKPSQDVSDSDLISRKAAIDALARMMPRSYTPDGSHPADEEIFRAQEIFADCIEALEILPSAQPEHKRGEWIGHPIKGTDSLSIDKDTCSHCGERFYQIAETGVVWNFCPNCGADMRKERKG